MKLVQIKRDALLKPLQAVTGIVEKRHTLPILSNVLIQRKHDQICLVATDLEIQVSTYCATDKKGEEELNLTVSARKLQDILRALPDETDTILDVQNNRLQVRAGKSRFNLQTLPASDFPTLADPGALDAKIQITQKQLRELLLLVQYSMAQQDIRYYLNGLLLVLEEEQLKLVATDGHRLAYASGKLSTPQEKREVIVPRKAVQELSKLLEDTEDITEIEFYATQVRFRFATIDLSTKIIDGKFPDYTRVIPQNYQKNITLDRLQLLQSLQRAAILSNEKYHGARWILGKDTLRITCMNNEQEEAHEELEISYIDEPLDIGFNINYLLDVLNNVQVEKVCCAFGDANSSMLVTLPSKSDFRYVVMPMRI